MNIHDSKFNVSRAFYPLYTSFEILLHDAMIPETVFSQYIARQVSQIVASCTDALLQGIKMYRNAEVTD